MKHIAIDLSNKAWQWFTLMLLALIWGSSFIFMKRGLESFTDAQVAAFRVFISFLFFLPIALKRLKYLKKENIKSLLLVGFVGNGIPAFLFTKAQTQVSSSLAGMLNSLVPLFALIVGYLFYKVQVKKLNVLGVFIGLIGAVGLIVMSSEGVFSASGYYSLFIVLATICYSISVNEIKQKLVELDGVSIMSFAFMFIGPWAGLFLLFSDYSYTLSTPGYIHNFTYVFFLALFSSVIANIIFNYLIKHTTALFATSVTYLIPAVAILLGALDGESIRLGQLLFIAIILGGVSLVNKK
ncbi:MAG: EamA family transporter [Candidatus Hydrothermae bacterium]|nr:EamA family transporter [Candidatus Hydrothermae bacterium]